MLFYISKHNDSINVRYNVKANLITVIPLLLIALTTFLLLLFFVNITFMKILFGVISLIILASIVTFAVFTVKFELTISKTGVLYTKAFTTVFLSWSDINEIGICYSKSRDNVSHHYYQPQTSLYFASRHLTDHEKTAFYDKRLPKSIKAICWTETSTQELDNLLVEVSSHIQGISKKEIISFNCNSLKYNL